MHRYVLYIDVGRFRILRAKGGANSQQARFLINQCQIITFLILKSDVENSRIELKGIVLPVPSNLIKVIFIIILPFNLVHL